MADYIITRADGESFQHYGIKGQRWGVRRYENADGTLTEEGRARYRGDAEKARKEIGDASRDPKTGIGSSQAIWMTRGRSGKQYRELTRIIEKETRKEANAYNKSFSKKSSISTKEAGKQYADAIASVGLQYINANFSEADKGRAKGFVYAMFVQEQDKNIRLPFGKINN